MHCGEATDESVSDDQDHARSMEEAILDTDSGHNSLEMQADSEGVWEQSFCVVCNCLIQTEPSGLSALGLEDDVWEAAAVSKKRSHALDMQPNVRSSLSPNEKKNHAPLFCSDECRRVDMEKSNRMSEFMQYVSPTTNLDNLEMKSYRKHSNVPINDTHRAFAQSFAGFSLANSLPKGVAPAEMRPRDVSHSHKSFRASKTNIALPSSPISTEFHRSPPSSSATSPSMSNLARARNIQTLSPKQLSGEKITETDSFIARQHSDSSEPNRLSSGILSASPLDLLPSGQRLRAAPSVSVEKQAEKTIFPPSDTTKPMRNTTSAMQALLRTKQRQNDARVGANSLTTIISSMLKNADVDSDDDGVNQVPVSSLVANESRRRVPSDSLGEHLKIGTKTLTSSNTHSKYRQCMERDSSDIHQSHRRNNSTSGESTSTTTSKLSSSSRHRAHHSRDMHVLPPLFGSSSKQYRMDHTPSSIKSNEGSLRDTSQRSFTTSTLTPGLTTGSRSLSRSFGLATSGMHHQPISLPGSSPRRSGLGWSALGPRSIQPNTPMRGNHAGDEQDVDDEVRTERSSSIAGSPSWRYRASEGDLKMYPILQLPDTNIHDTYSEYWQAPDAYKDGTSNKVNSHLDAGSFTDSIPSDASSQTDTLLSQRMAQTELGTRPGRNETRRKSLFHFDV
ncbi:hypothetical protein MYAM1_004067 [Malassezia yamatoensis]|uniref:Uncharacterized protein n=1 Tax=Malassezia yamatoensis TaxID=253288 RepID=A0AAJ5Z2Q5_9BASI|nr:hypothetical protein MYAM1_004067 [Malassezia yamatoensis]